MDPWKNVKDLTYAQRRELQNKKLHQFINHYVYPFSPHYRKIFDQNNINPQDIRTVEDLSKIPLSSKLDFVEQEEQKGETFKNFVLQPDKEKIRRYWPKSKLLRLAGSSLLHGSKYTEEKISREFRPVFMTFTTGTTNKPVPFLYSNHDMRNLHIFGARMLTLFDIQTSEKLVNMFPYAPHLAFWQVVCGGFESCALTLSTGGGKTMGTEGNIAAILKMQPSILLGVPSYVYHVLRAAKEKGCKMDSIKKVVLGASRITPAFKAKLAELLKSMGANNVSVFGTYGFTEARCAWAECPTAIDVSSGYHLYADKEIFEVVDPKTGEVKGEGEDGELVYTSLDSRASTVIRYRTGDFVKGGITHEPCPHCGRHVTRISSDITRLSDIKDLQLTKIKGALVNLNHFTAILSDVEMIDDWQIEIRKKNNDPFEMDELVVYVCVRDTDAQDQLEEEIKREMLLATELAPNAIYFVSREEIVKRLELETANKDKRIIDSRPKN